MVRIFLHLDGPERIGTWSLSVTRFADKRAGCSLPEWSLMAIPDWRNGDALEPWAWMVIEGW
ncbi:hypothetical protein A3197_00155 [Candidatus Thiodiazotropha endoloripes]|nr:hypothetical protein A3197_00155 [Candidatus Thiodiazotropha endoloripes]